MFSVIKFLVIIFPLMTLSSLALAKSCSSLFSESSFTSIKNNVSIKKNPYFLEEHEIRNNNFFTEGLLTEMSLKDDLPAPSKRPLNSKDFDEKKLKKVFETALTGSQTAAHTGKRRRVMKNFDRAWPLIIDIINSPGFPRDQIIELNKILREGDYTPPKGLEELKYSDFRFSETIGYTWFETIAKIPTRFKQLFEMTEYQIRTKELSPLFLGVNFYINFTQVHPFPEANGRTGRILASIIMMKAGLPPIKYNLTAKSHEEIMVVRKPSELFRSFFKDYMEGVEYLSDTNP